MRVLLTGGTGFVGNHLKNYLKQNTDWEIVLAKRQDLMKGLPELGDFDYIIHLASASSVEQSIKQPSEFVKDNIIITLNVLEYARTHKIKTFLLLSTVEVYNVTNPYAASKAAQEEIVNAYWKTYGVPAIIARSSNVIGEGQSKEKFVPKLIDQLAKGETVNIYTTNGQEGARVYNTVKNVCSALVYLLGIYPQPPKNEQDFPIHYDIDGGNEMTNLQMALMVAGKLKTTLKYKFVEPTEVRPTYAKSLVADGVKLTTTGWQPNETLDEGLSWIK